ncbi:MAG: hypothetical protein LRY41_01965 [Candidatus Pacebacteria bacterium]|nr:hypothetical protein [Candidatus Paceibacterota bacterium]MCD8507985.1 hypothetical protein [Candidatus Paceibacterota bacterium]MCD8528074.1 hypothetical protein [Candidatus Paceibacterota bacterium]MCD8564031.1 hypothetical protein [Candidatus Paceibacterota bacterium]
MKEIGKLMGSDARVKILRLFLFNEELVCDADMVADKSRTTLAKARNEIKMLESIGFLKKKQFTKEVLLKPLKKQKDGRAVKKKATGWQLEKKFPLVAPMQKLLLDPELIPTKDLPERLKGMGSIKLLAVSGLFKSDHDRKLDLLIVGEKLHKTKLEKMVRILESEIGKEIRYALFDTEEFKYRYEMYDHLIHEVFDYAHDMIVNKLGIAHKQRRI